MIQKLFKLKLLIEFLLLKLTGRRCRGDAAGNISDEHDFIEGNTLAASEVLTNTCNPALGEVQPAEPEGVAREVAHRPADNLQQPSSEASGPRSEAVGGRYERQPYGEWAHVGQGFGGSDKVGGERCLPSGGGDDGMCCVEDGSEGAERMLELLLERGAKGGFGGGFVNGSLHLTTCHHFEDIFELSEDDISTCDEGRIRGLIIVLVVQH